MRVMLYNFINLVCNRHRPNCEIICLIFLSCSLIYSLLYLGVSGRVVVKNGSLGKEPTASSSYDKSSCTSARDLVLPSYNQSCSSTPIYYCSPQKHCSYVDPDSHSLTSQDSGIPTLEINPPDSVLNSHSHPGDAGEDSPATLPLDNNPSDSNGMHRSSTFPRSGYDSARHFSPGVRLTTTSGLSVGGGALNRSDDISVCSVSSMSTELSVSNEDILDFTVTSDSSAIVTLETDLSGSAHFSDVTLSSSPGEFWSPGWGHPGSAVIQPDDGKLRKLGPFANLFNRQVNLQ